MTAQAGPQTTDHRPQTTAGDRKFLQTARGYVSEVAKRRGLGPMAKEIYKEDVVRDITHGRTIHFKDLDLGERAMVLARFRQDLGLDPWRRQPRQRLPKDPPNVIRMATTQAIMFLRSLTEQLRWDMKECADYFRRACGTEHPKTGRQISQCTEMCKAVIARRKNAG